MQVGALQILEKGLNKPFKQHIQDAALAWAISNHDTAKPSRVDVFRWIQQAWNRITTESITNTWNSVVLHGYKAGGAEVWSSILSILC